MTLSADTLIMLASTVGALLVFGGLFYALQGYRLLGIAMIPSDGLGIVTKKFGVGGKSRLPDGHLIALNKEAGYQADTLGPGLYFGFWPWQYSIQIDKFVTVPQGQVGIVEAKDGEPIPAGRILGKHIDCDFFQDSRAFLSKGGQRGPQIDPVPPGTYRFNSSLISIKMVDAVVVPQGKVGIVTTLDGLPLPANEIAGKVIDGHQSFQNGDKFISSGGQKGLQEQVILSGMYYINPLFVRIEVTDLQDIPIGYVGVVVSFVGTEGKDTSGAAFTHGNIVSKGQKGVWSEPLDPGRYPINPRIMRVEPVPTTNIVLNWATGKSEAHQLDKNLSTITVRSGDGFTFNLDVSQIIHVSRENAPRVIARFGTMVNLVTQVLEPTIGNYFRNSAQSSDVINFLSQRSTRQQEAAGFIKDALEKYNVQAVDTLIGDITPPEQLMGALTDRKIAEQRKITYATQEAAEVQRQEFEKAKSEADTRGQIVAASRALEVSKFTADALIARAQGEAGSKTTNADADARVLLVTGEAAAKRTQLIGDAEASVLQKKVAAVSADKYALMDIVGRLSEAKTPLVPQIQVGGDGQNRSTLIDAFVGNLLAKDINGSQSPGPNVSPKGSAGAPAR